MCADLSVCNKIIEPSSTTDRLKFNSVCRHFLILETKTNFCLTLVGFFTKCLTSRLLILCAKTVLFGT